MICDSFLDAAAQREITIAMHVCHDMTSLYTQSVCPSPIDVLQMRQHLAETPLIHTCVSMTQYKLIALYQQNACCAHIQGFQVKTSCLLSAFEESFRVLKMRAVKRE